MIQSNTHASYCAPFLLTGVDDRCVSRAACIDWGGSDQPRYGKPLLLFEKRRRSTQTARVFARCYFSIFPPFVLRLPLRHLCVVPVYASLPDVVIFEYDALVVEGLVASLAMRAESHHIHASRPALCFIPA